MEKWPSENKMDRIAAEEEIKELAEQLKEMPVVKKALQIIEEGLPRKYPELAEKNRDVLDYHGKPHTDDVIEESLLLASYYDGQLSDHDRELLGIAAAYHDTGFTESYDANEPIGAEIAEKEMRESGYNEEDVKRVKDAIVSTRIKFVDGRFTQLVEGNDLIAKILADADLGNFGREDFEEKGTKIFNELVSMKRQKDTPESRLNSKKFGLTLLSTHEWQSEAAKTLRSEQERKNLGRLREEFGQQEKPLAQAA